MQNFGGALIVEVIPVELPTLKERLAWVSNLNLMAMRYDVKKLALPEHHMY